MASKTEMRVVGVRIPQASLEQLDKRRGQLGRSEFIRHAIQDHFGAGGKLENHELRLRRLERTRRFKARESWVTGNQATLRFKTYKQAKRFQEALSRIDNEVLVQRG